MYAAACSLGDFVFVLAGSDCSIDCINSVERMNVPAIASSVAAWELIQLPEIVFTPRNNPAVVALNENMIAILGGRDPNERCLSDVVVFNVTNKVCHKVTDSGDYTFESFSNQCAMVGNKVIALAFGGPSQDTFL